MKRIRYILGLTAIIVLSTGITLAAEQGEEKTGSADGNSGKQARGSESSNENNFNYHNSRGLSILESLEGPSFSVTNYDRNDRWAEDDRDNDRMRRRLRFRGHWSGLELGFNNYMMSDNSVSLPDDIGYMTLNSGKSTNFNINFAQFSIGLGRHIGFVTGLGLNWNNYRFDRNNNIMKDFNGHIVELDPGVTLKKSKLTTLYLTLPLMFEVQIPANANHLTLAAGPIGALKIGSHTKMVYDDGEKVKSNGDFSLNMLRYGATARVGYGNFMIYGTCYKTPLFQTGKGPGAYDLYPFEIGIALTFNN
jgi:hypothetical protein